MRRFIITNPKFTGQAEVTYNEIGTLIRIDISNTNMGYGLVSHFKAMVPATLHALINESPFKEDTVIIEADFIITFDMFWNFYDKKIKRHRCEPLWNKLSKTDQVKAYHGIKEYDRHLKKENWKSKAEPATYLQNKYWENEYN